MPSLDAEFLSTGGPRENSCHILTRRILLAKKVLGYVRLYSAHRLIRGLSWRYLLRQAKSAEGVE
jgi:hypothetical protein